MKNEIQIYCMALQDRSDRVRWLLEEMNIPYKDHFLSKSKGELLNPDYLKLNPMGRVPTVVDQDVVLFESAAICMYLADKYSLGNLAPNYDSVHRASYLQWMIWSVGSLECVVARMFTHVNTDEEKKQTQDFVKEQSAVLSRALIPVLQKQDYILPTGFSAADIMLASIIPGAWDYLVKDQPVMEQYMNRLMNRPAAIKAKVFTG